MSITLKNSKTPAILRSEIILKSSWFVGIFLAVEGDFDSRFWGTRIDTKSARIVHCGGKLNLLGLVDLYEQHDYERLTAIVDADFDRVLGSVRTLWCLSYTDMCDLESTLINGDAFRQVIAEYGDQLKIRNFEDSRGLEIKENIRSISTVFGRLRFINTCRGYGVDFNKLSPYKYVDSKNWAVDESALRNDFLGLARITNTQLVDDEGELFSQLICDPWSFVQGHDCMKVLAIGLGSLAIGRAGQKAIDQAELQKAFRLAVDPVNLAQTTMYQHLVSAQFKHGLPLFA